MVLQRGEVGPEMKKFEQVLSDHQQVLLAGVGQQVWCLWGYGL